MKARVPVVLLLLAPSTSFAHGKSKSFAEWIFRARGAELRINFAGHDLAASVPGIDLDEDRNLTVAEFESKRELIGARTIEHSVLSGCRADGVEVKSLGDPVVTEVAVRVDWKCDAEIEKVHVESRQLPELEPPHVTVATFLAGKNVAQHVFSAASPAFDLEVELPSLAEELGTTLLAGVRALLHPAALLFLLGLLLFERPRRTILLFAIALGAWDLAGLALPLSPPPSWYPIPFVLAVAWTGVELIARQQREMPKRKPILGALFAAWFGAVLAPRVDLPSRLAFALGETALATVWCALAAVLAVVLGDRMADYRRPVGIAWMCGAGALAALSLI